jgi:hypothetical protein
VTQIEKFKNLWGYLSNEAIGSCGIPCSIMDINFGYPIIDTTNIDEAYVKLYFKMAVNIHRNILAYSTLSFLAEVGGYIGLLLGFSLLDLSKVIKNLTPNIKKRIVKRRTKEERTKVTPKENPRKIFTLAYLGSVQN